MPENTEPTETVHCTNCGSKTEVPERHAGHFHGDGDGLCKSCHMNADMPDPVEPQNAYEEVMRDMRGEYREYKKERQNKQSSTGEGGDNSPRRRSRSQRLSDYYC